MATITLLSNQLVKKKKIPVKDKNAVISSLKLENGLSVTVLLVCMLKTATLLFCPVLDKNRIPSVINNYISGRIFQEL